MMEKMTVLIIDSCSDDSLLLREYLDSVELSPDILCAASLKQAADVLRDESVDVVLLNIDLPDGEHADVIKHFVDSYPGLPVIALTAKDDDSLAMRALRGGAQDYLVKGAFSPTTLARATRQAVERKRNEEQLRRSRELLATTGKMAKVGGWELEPGSGSIRWSEFNLNLHEVDEDYQPELEGFLKFFPGGEGGELRRAMDAALEKGERFDLELPFITAKGKQLWVHVICDPLTENGKVVKLIGATQDITQRKLAEREQEKLQNQLLQSQRMESVGRLAGGVAHDFNNMLQVILGYSEMIIGRDAEAGSDLHDDMLRIQKAAQHSAELTRQLLAFARKQAVNPETLTLNDVIAIMLKMLRRLIGEDIDLVWMPGSDLWSVIIDPSQVDQLLANLVVNARDAIEGGGRITIETENAFFDDIYRCAHSELVPGEYVRLAVSDNGRGMDKETMAHIFEPFFTSKAFGEGTGLGLATVYGIVKQNNGYIHVYSEPDRGTTFKIYLPRTGVAPSEEPVRKELPRSGHERVLLVEDEVEILELGRAMLEDLGYNVMVADSPEKAVAMMQNCPDKVDLMVTDVVMPGMNGRELADRIAEIRPGLKFLFMSGYTADVIAHHGVLAKGVSFVQKPFSKRGLAEKVRQALDN